MFRSRGPHWRWTPPPRGLPYSASSVPASVEADPQCSRALRCSSAETGTTFVRSLYNSIYSNVDRSEWWTKWDTRYSSRLKHHIVKTTDGNDVTREGLLYSLQVLCHHQVDVLYLNLLDVYRLAIPLLYIIYSFIYLDLGPITNIFEPLFSTPENTLEKAYNLVSFVYVSLNSH
jgi:hypothetical protein